MFSDDPYQLLIADIILQKSRIHVDFLTRQQFFYRIPFFPAAEMRQYQFSRRCIPYGAGNFFHRRIDRLGQSDIHSRMNGNDQPFLRSRFQNPQITDIVHVHFLISRMNLNTFQPQTFDFLYFPPDIRTVRMNAAERDQSLFLFTKFCRHPVYRLKLDGLCHHRQDHGNIHLTLLHTPL